MSTLWRIDNSVCDAFEALLGWRTSADEWREGRWSELLLMWTSSVWHDPRRTLNSVHLVHFVRLHLQFSSVNRLQCEDCLSSSCLKGLKVFIGTTKISRVITSDFVSPLPGLKAPRVAHVKIGLIREFFTPPQGGGVFTPTKFSGHPPPQDQTPTGGFKHCVHCNSTLSWPASAANEILLAGVLCTHASATLHCHLAVAAGVMQGLQLYSNWACSLEQATARAVNRLSCCSPTWYDYNSKAHLQERSTSNISGVIHRTTNPVKKSEKSGVTNFVMSPTFVDTP